MDGLQRWLAEVSQSVESLSDLRAAPRYNVHGPVRLGTCSEQGAFVTQQTGWIIDLSAQGIGLLVEQPLQRGQVLRADLSRIVRVPCVLPMRVIYCQPLLSRTYRVGGLFVDETQT